MLKHLSFYTALTAVSAIITQSYAADGIYTEEITVNSGSELVDVINNMSDDDDKIVHIDGDINLDDEYIALRAGKLTLEGGSIIGNEEASETGLTVNEGTELTIIDTKISGLKDKGIDINGKVNLQNVDMRDNTNSFPSSSAAVNINQTGSAENIDGHFENNSAASRGGAIRNQGSIGKVSGTFTENKIVSNAYNGLGGSAIYNGGTSATIPSEIYEINANFNNNTALTNTNNFIYGTIFNDSYGSITKIVSNFTNNEVFNTITEDRLASVGGAAIGNQGTINEITGSFNENGDRLQGTFSGNIAGYRDLETAPKTIEAYGGAIYNRGTIRLIKDVKFSDNSAAANEDAAGGAIATTKQIERIENVVFENNKAFSTADAALGGALAIGTSTSTGSSSTAGVGEIVNSKFLNNTAEVQNAGKKVYGGAIYSQAPTLTLKADGGDTIISGNKTIQGGTENNNGVYLNSSNSNAAINLDAKNGGKIIIDDEIDGYRRLSALFYTVNIDGDESGEVQLNNNINNAKEIVLNNGTLTLGTKDSFDKGLTSAENQINTDINTLTNLTLASGTLNLENDNIQTIEVGIFDSSENVSLKIDANLADGSSDQIKAETISDTAKIKLGNINVIADGDSDIQVFKSDSGNAPLFTNLGNYASYTANYKYTFADKGQGILGIDQKEDIRKRGLNAAVEDSTSSERHYQVSDTEENVTGDLGELQGGSGTQLFVEGNGLDLNGGGYSGLIVNTGQEANFVDVNNVSGFSSENGGVVNNNGTLNIVNSSFSGNTANQGGAIYSTADINIEANGKDIVFENNIATSTGKSNAIYMAGNDKALNLKANNGTIRFEDGIDGSQPYNINVSGTTSEYNGTMPENGGIVFAGKLDNLQQLTINSSKVKLADESVINNASINLNGGHLDLTNGQLGALKLANFTGNNGLLSIDVKPSEATADQLVINGTASGHTRLYVNALDSSKPNSDILFATANGTVKDASFDVWRVAGSPYLWDTSYNPLSQQWFLNTQEMPTESNKIAVTPETADYIGLPSAGFEMTRDMLRNIQNKTNANVVTYGCCGRYNRNYNANNRHNAWVAPLYRSLEVRSSADYDADITGIEGGQDFAIDRYNRLGGFLSYRQGDFDFSGRGDDIISNNSSNTDIDSYVAGLYYAYNCGRSWLWSGIYGGYQDVNIKTRDGVRADTNGYQFGGRIAVGTNLNIRRDLFLSPIAALNYNLLHYEDFRDNAGKTINYDDISSLEAELGARLEQVFKTDSGYSKLYFQPSLVQYVDFNNKVNISNLAPMAATEDQTLGRMELGGRMSLNKQFMLFGNMEYTFGKGYKDTSVRAGVNYAF